MYHAECYVARRLLQLARSSQEIPVPKSFLQAEREGFKLAPAQKEAVLMAHKTGLLVITGGPGTGKTTIVKTLLELFRQNGLEVLLAAPTGRAAKRLTETAGMEAKTIQLLNTARLKVRVSSNERRKDSKAHVVIIDEMSMGSAAFTIC